MDYTCPKCKLELDESLFSKDASKPSGRYAWCKACCKIADKAHYQKYAELRREQMRVYRSAVKAQVFAHYGMACKCCGETQELFLDIDHMDNDGAAHRKKYNLTAGTQVYIWLIKNNFPSNFQTLCCNCNRGKFRNGGICPHQLSPQS